MARLRYGFVVKCTGCDKDADRNIVAECVDSKEGVPVFNRTVMLKDS